MSESYSETDGTMSYYEQNALVYAERTGGVRLDALWKAFSGLLWPGAYVLDLGCGAGRDLKELSSRGFRVVGVDYSAPLAAIAREYSGQDVVVMDIRRLDFDPDVFDGIWAVASLLHVARGEVLSVLADLHRILRPAGILLTSMQRGEGQEISEDSRCFELYTREKWEIFLRAGGFEVDQVQETVVKSPTRRSEVSWFVTIGRKR